MNLIWNTVEGSQEEKPKEIETISSKTTIYLRKNIKRMTRHDEITGDDSEFWQYDEATLTQREYEQYAAEHLLAITPYTATKTAYIGDTEITFYDTPATGNLTVYCPGNYHVDRLVDRIFITFDELEEVTEITISIL